MEAPFLRPLRKLRSRLHECPPLAFVVDALDECMSEAEVPDLISLLGRAFREPDLPVIHILLTSRLEEPIRDAIQREEVRPLVCEIPVKITGEGVAAIISLDRADVDNDIYIFLEYSFRKLQGQYPIFPQPTRDELARLASRAGRRFIDDDIAVEMDEFGYTGLDQVLVEDEDNNGLLDDDALGAEDGEELEGGLNYDEAEGIGFVDL